MKLFLATNSGTSKSINIKLLEKACKSALKNTNLEVFVIFDGNRKELKLPKEVTIIEHKHRCYDTFFNSPRNTNNGFINIASGTFLRTEIPFLCKKLGFDDKYCLYTDYDVMFLKGDYSDLDNINPIYFAACPEGNKNDWSYINAGVMLMNIHHFLDQDEFIKNYIDENFEKLVVWDQTMYNNLYRNKYEKLPLEYNWKPYWGINNKAKIIHFHGAKPLAVEPESRKNEAIVKHLRELDEVAYNHYNIVWQQM